MTAHFPEYTDLNMTDQVPKFIPAKLDASLYNLDEQEISFFKEKIGITDDAALRDHIFAVQAEAYEVIRSSTIKLAYFVLIKHLPLSW